MAKELGGGEILKWNGLQDKPQTVQGIFRGVRSLTTDLGEGYLLDLEVEDGMQTWGCPQILQTKVALLRIGDGARISHFGKEVQKSGREAHIFKVWLLEPRELPISLRK